MSKVPFNRFVAIGRELDYLAQALASSHFASDGPFSARCKSWFASEIGAPHTHLTNSATAAIELATILAALEPGDEVIMPAFTYVTCANAVALRRAIPVFVDICPDTLNIDVNAAAQAVTPRTRALIVVHYAGIPCDMDAVIALAKRHDLIVIEDAAQAFLSRYRGRPAGTLGHLGVFSFHHTKNVTCGEGGALLVNDPRFIDRAGIVHQKGTDRMAFARGEVAAYNWTDLGSSFAPSDLTAAVLLAQLEHAVATTDRRRALWDRYHAAFAGIEMAGVVRRPQVPPDAVHNGHLYYLLLADERARNEFIARLAQVGVDARFHFMPLDRSKGGQKFGRSGGRLPVTHAMAARLVRLPLWLDMKDAQDRVIEAVLSLATR